MLKILQYKGNKAPMRKQLQLKLFAYTNIAALALLGFFIYENYQSQGLIFQVAKNDIESVKLYFSSLNFLTKHLILLGLVLIEVVIGVIPAIVMYPIIAMIAGWQTSLVIIFIGNITGNLLNFYQGKLISKALLESKKHKGFLSRLSDGGFKLIFLLRLNPLSSVDSISYFAGALGMNVYKFMLATLAGTTPLIIVATFFGSSVLEKYNIGLELLVIFTFIYIADQLRRIKIVQKIKTVRNRRLARKKQ